MNGLALCAGIGGLELGLRLVLGNRYRTVCYVEREAYAAAVLVARMADGTLDPAPLWDDLQSFDGRPWRGVVDLLTAGFPCQPHSLAGCRRGPADERWIWPDIVRIIREVRPWLVFLENVPGLATSGLGHVLGDLATCGYDAEWDVFSAAALGAPHVRERLFLLAYADSPGCSQPLAELRRFDAPRAGAGLFPPGPDDRAAWLEVLARDLGLAPALDPAVCGVADGIPRRVDRLRALGNAVVPLVAATAFRELIGRIVGGD